MELELFFSTLDEETTEYLIEVFETGDEAKLMTFIDKSELKISKDQFLKGLEMLKEMKEMMG